MRQRFEAQTRDQRQGDIMDNSIYEQQKPKSVQWQFANQFSWKSLPFK